MVSPSDDLELIQRYLATHDAGLREEIILRYVPLVHFVLGRLGLSRSMGADYEDAVSQGLLGLIEAIDRFDPAFGAQFSTYATLKVRGRVLDHLRSLDWLSRTARRRARTVQDAANVLWNRLGRSPTDDELAKYLGIEMPELQHALIDAGRVIVSLDTMMDSEGDESSSLYEVLADNRQGDPSELFEDQDLKECLLAALKSLSEREQLVLAMYYFEELTFKEVGAVLEISESRVCQIHARSLINLRAALVMHTAIGIEDRTNQSVSGVKTPLKQGPPTKGFDKVSGQAAR
jgi:RNA polymerase sigma factor FliA